MRASQYNAALPSLPRTDLCSAEIMSYLSSPVRSYEVETERRRDASKFDGSVEGAAESTSSSSDKATRASPDDKEMIEERTFDVS